MNNMRKMTETIEMPETWARVSNVLSSDWLRMGPDADDESGPGAAVVTVASIVLVVVPVDQYVRVSSVEELPAPLTRVGIRL